MTPSATELLSDCDFPAAGTAVALAVSGGADSVGLVLLALEAGLEVSVHHVDHHARLASGEDARYVEWLCAERSIPFFLYHVEVDSGANFEARARALRRAILPDGVLTGHTMDDLAETVLLNLLRGAGVDGLSPMVGDPTKPLRSIRRGDLRAYVEGAGVAFRHDESNDDLSFRRNRVRHKLLPLMNDVAERDVVPLLARQATLLFDERRWLDELGRDDVARALGEPDTRELVAWPRARLRRWLRAKLATPDELGEQHPPSAAEVERALVVIDGDVVATELSGGRRLARRDRHLVLEGPTTTLTNHG